MPDFNTLKNRIMGPVYPIVPAFNEDYSLDLASVKRYVNYLIEGGADVIMLTAGTSRFNLLQDDEIKQLNEAVIQAVDGRAVTVGANPMYGSTARAVDFAQHIEAQGGDIILLYYPERYYGDEYVYDYFAEVASNCNIGVMIHAMPMRHASGGTAGYSVDLCNRLTNDFANIIGMKEEHGDINHRYKLGTFAPDMRYVVAGGGMRTFVASHLFGIQSYLTGVGSFKPELTIKFYNALLSDDKETALAIVRDYEAPLFDVSVPIGWHVSMKTILHLMGLMPITERLPLQQPSEVDMAKLQQLITRFDWV